MVSTSAFVGGCVLLFFASVLASAGGVGGGGLFVPVLLLVFDYSFDTAVAFSVCIILGSACAQFIINITKRHPIHQHKPLIYWELVLTLLPAQLGGNNIGGILAKVAPDVVVYVLAFVVLIITGGISLKKGLQKWETENMKGNKMESQLSPVTMSQNPMQSSTQERSTAASSLYSSTVATDTYSMKAERASELEKGDVHHSIADDVSTVIRESLTMYTNDSQLVLPTKYIVVMAFVWICFACLSVGKALVTTCSDAYSALVVLVYVPVFIGHTCAYFFNASDVSPKSDVDIKSRMFMLMGVAYVVGVLCSMIGIGGGEVFSPFILSLNVIPEVTSGTTATMSFLNALTSVLKNLAGGTFDIETGAILCLVGFGGGVTGRQLGLWFSSKYGRASVIVFSLTAGLFLSALYYIYVFASQSLSSALGVLC